MASGRMEFHSEALMQHANFSFVLPYDTPMPEVKEPKYYERPPKSLILLHGLTGTDTDWLFGGIAQIMSIHYNLAIFMPTTGNSFYLDKGYPGGNNATFVGEELPDFINKVFGFCESRENTLVGGLSMGGYGAFHTAFAYPDRFSGVVALSSAIVFDSLIDRFRREGLLDPERSDNAQAPYQNHAAVSDDNSVVAGSKAGSDNSCTAAEAADSGSKSQKGADTGGQDFDKVEQEPDPVGDLLPLKMLLDIFGDPKKQIGSDRDLAATFLKLKAGHPDLLPKMYMAIGTEDTLLDANRDFARFLKENGADITYEEGPGIHDWVFWNEYIDRGIRNILG